MPTSARIILTDVDGVLLEWERHFTKWMQLRSYFDEHGIRNYPYKLVDTGQDDYEMANRFGVSKDVIRQEIREFNRSAWMGTQTANAGITDLGQTATRRGVDLRTNNITDFRHTGTRTA